MTYKSILITLLAVLAFSSCQQEATDNQEATTGKGRVALSLSAEDAICVSSRSSNPSIEELTFTIKASGAESGTPITFTQLADEYVAYLEAGTYTLTAASTSEGANQGLGDICYEGTSSEFTIQPGETTNISLTLTPANAKISIVIDNSSLQSFYGTSTTVSITAPRNITISNNSDVYVPAGTVTYSVIATALPQCGATSVNKQGSITVEAGKAYTLTITATPGGTIIFETTATTQDTDVWDGEFS